MPFVRAAKTEDVPTGKIYEFQVGGQAVAIANIDGNLFAISSVCPHQGGPLGEGELEGKIVTCPWHAWQCDVTTGKMVDNPGADVKTYPLEVRGPEIFIDIDS